MSDLIQTISIGKITDPENPMRSDMDRDAIFDLSESILREGLINPITVRPIHKSDVGGSISPCTQGEKCVSDEHRFYEVVAGHRRFVACKLAGLTELPCVVRELNDAQAFEVMAHENLHREDVDPVDEALFLGRVIGEDELKIPEIAQRLNRSIQWVEERLNILTYPDYMLPPLKTGLLKLGVAKFLAQIEDDTYRKIYVEQAINQGMGIRQAEYLSQQYKMGVLVPLDKLPETSEIGEPRVMPAASAMCARCGRRATAPNLQNVFIHVECPPDNA